MMRETLAAGTPRRTVVLHGCSYVEELGYRDLLEDWQSARTYPVTYVPTISRPNDPRNAGWTGRTGRVELVVVWPHQLAAGVVEDLAEAAQVHHLDRNVGVLWRFQRTADSPDAAAVLDAAEEHRLPRGFVAERCGVVKHQPAVGDEHLTARIHPQQRRIRPPRGGRLDIGAELVGAVGTDARQQRNAAQLKVHARPP